VRPNTPPARCHRYFGNGSQFVLIHAG
jgi:hypothetical protein